MSEARSYDAWKVADFAIPATPDFAIPATPLEVDSLANEVGRAAVRRLLDALAISPSRTVRRRAFDRLVERGSETGPEAAARLRKPDQPWYVVRNLLGLLVALPEIPGGAGSPSLYATHPHPAVRLEALRLLVRMPRRRNWAICRLLTEEDPKALAVGLAAAQQEPPPEAVPLLLAVAGDETLSHELRRLAVRALAATGAPEAKVLLLSLATAPSRWYDRPLRRTRLAPRSGVLLEAVTGLRGWADDPAVRRVLRRAAVDLDRQVRRAASGLA